MKELTKQEAETRNALSHWTFDVDGREVTVEAMTENQARMGAAYNAPGEVIGVLVRVTE